jgi:hypothetical protein
VLLNPCVFRFHRTRGPGTQRSSASTKGKRKSSTGVEAITLACLLWAPNPSAMAGKERSRYTCVGVTACDILRSMASWYTREAERLCVMQGIDLVFLGLLCKVILVNSQLLHL